MHVGRLLALSCGVWLAAAAGPGPTILRVDDDAPAGGDGSSWPAAYQHLQDALAAAVPPVEIRVAQGVYKPDQGAAQTPGDRDATFRLINGVSLMGGYAGIGAPDPDARDIVLFETILTGDLLGNDSPDFANNDENSFHVTAGHFTNQTAVLDGFTVTAGNAGAFLNGAGMFNIGGSPSVTNCTFSGNNAFDAGGMYNFQSSPLVFNCTFSGNNATRFGGGMNNHTSSPMVIDCTFSKNSGSVGGGMFNRRRSTPTVTNCIFSGNTAQHECPDQCGSGVGGGMANDPDSSPTVTSCMFIGNSALGPGGKGGGMVNGSINPGGPPYDSRPTLIDCTFSGNSAASGGAIWNQYAEIVLDGCTFDGNVSKDQGSAIRNIGLNTTIVGTGRVIGGSVLGTDQFVNSAEVSPGETQTPGSIGTLIIALSFVQTVANDPAGVFVFDLAGTKAGSEHDQAVFTVPATLNGGLRVELVKGYTPELGDRFVVLTAPSLSGQFDVALLPGLPDGLFMRVEYNTGGAASGAGTGEVVIVVDSLATLFEGFGDPESVEQFAGTPTAVALGDFDGLNGNDLAITIPGKGPHVLVLLNAGTDTMGNWQGFLGSAQTPVGVDPSGIAVGLFDGDQLLDAAVSNAGDGTVSILLNQGSDPQGNWLGLAPGPGPITVGVNPIAIVSSTKLDGDSFADLAVANAGGSSGEVVVLLGTGMGTFSTLPAIGLSGVPSSLVAGDIDDEPKDLDDIVTANSSAFGADTVSVIVNLGGGAFADPIDLPIPEDAAPAAVIIADLDTVGLADIVTANRGIGTVSVILNDGGGVFRAAVGLPVGDQPRSITSIDLGGDGDFDIAVVVTNELGDPIVQVLRNDLSNGQLIFADAEQLDAGANPVLLITGDLDGDLADDLIVINEGGGGAAAAGGNGGPTMSSVNVGLNEFCAADMDNSGSVGILDFLALLAAWGTNPGGPPDFDDDGIVGIADFLTLLANWGPCF